MLCSAESSTCDVDSYPAVLRTSLLWLTAFSGLTWVATLPGLTLSVQYRVRHGAVGTLVSGDFDIDTHVAHGARPVGPVMSLTHARDNAVLELDDAPAHPRLLETLESLPETSKALPVMLGLGVNGSKGPFVCRDILSVGETGGVEVASAALREGAAVQLLSLIHI